MANILITGDFVITDNDYTIDKIDPAVRNLFENSDLNVLNLECPITVAKAENRINKTGPHLIGSKKATSEILRKLNVNVVTLANNHILDYGRVGLSDTLAFCKDLNISTVGAGLTNDQSIKPFRTVVDGVTLSILNFSENEWSTLDEYEGATANALDLIDNIKQIAEEKKSVQKVIVIIHGGHEYYSLPSPRMVKHYRYYAENGADIIVGHHTHCISGYEIHKQTPIYYGLGNFLFTKKSKYQDWYLGFILKINVLNGELIPSIVPIKQSDDFSVSLLSADMSEDIVKQVNMLNDDISNKHVLLERWQEYLKERSSSYLNYFSILSYIKNPMLRILINKVGLSRILLNKSFLLLVLNLLRCEAHSDTSKGVIKNYLNKR